MSKTLELLKVNSPALFSFTEKSDVYQQVLNNPDFEYDEQNDVDYKNDRIFALRRRYRTKLLKIALLDLENNPIEIEFEVSKQLAKLAQETLQVALEISANELNLKDPKFAIIAMGKTGGEELNYISDIDLIYIAEEELIRNGLANKLAVRISQICFSEINSEPGLWEIDLNLRPEGKNGPIVRTLESTKSYYEKWAVSWEFQALLKARFIAGDRKIGEDYERMAEDFCFQAKSRQGFVEDCRRMRQRVIDNIENDDKEREIKLGVGGLRDVEFTVQLLQLVHGLQDSRIRSKNTVLAIEQLTTNGYINRNDGDKLIHSYKFLRAIEHHLQFYNMKRTHLFPKLDESGIELINVIAKRFELKTDEFIEEYKRIRKWIRGVHLSIYFRPILEVNWEIDNETRTLEKLESLGFIDPKAALIHIQSLTKGTSRAVMIQKLILPAFLYYLSISGAQKQYALLTFRKICERLADTRGFLGMLRDNHLVLNRLAEVLSKSTELCNLVANQPLSVELLADDSELTPRVYSKLAEKFDSLIERGVNGLKGAYNFEKIRIIFAYILGVIDELEVGNAISELTDLLILKTLNSITSLEIYPIALGRFGSKEMGFSSDADMFFIHSDSVEAGDAIKAVSKLKETLNEIEIDLELRPEGKLGQISKSFSQTLNYYQNDAEVWELQALIRSRELKVLPNNFKLNQLIKPLTTENLQEIRRIKARVEKERLGLGVTKGQIDYKIGQGGLADVEWLIQIKQLQGIFESPELRTSSTIKALEILTNFENPQLRISEDDSKVLKDAWIRATRLRNFQALKIVPDNGQEAADDEYMFLARKARAVFEKLF